MGRSVQIDIKIGFGAKGNSVESKVTGDSDGKGAEADKRLGERFGEGVNNNLLDGMTVGEVRKKEADPNGAMAARQAEVDLFKQLAEIQPIEEELEVETPVLEMGEME